MERIFSLGAEKVAINSEAFVNLDLIRQAARRFGSQSIVGSVDVKKNMLGRYEVWVRGGTVNAHLNPVEYAQKLEDAGAGELFLNSIDRDGTMMGYDLALIRSVTRAVRIPVVAIGGAGSVDDLVAAVHEGGASAAGAGAMFVFHGKHRAVLITYPDRDLLNQKLHSCS